MGARRIGKHHAQMFFADGLSEMLEKFVCQRIVQTQIDGISIDDMPTSGKDANADYSSRPKKDLQAMHLL